MARNTSFGVDEDGDEDENVDDMFIEGIGEGERALTAGGVGFGMVRRRRDMSALGSRPRLGSSNPIVTSSECVLVTSKESNQSLATQRSMLYGITVLYQQETQLINKNQKDVARVGHVVGPLTIRTVTRKG
jgi:hypothetical protein